MGIIITMTAITTIITGTTMIMNITGTAMPTITNITVTNNGPVAASKATVTLTLPSGVTVSGALPAGCVQPNATTVKCTVATLGDFGRREDADEVAKVLENAGVWHRIAANEDGSAENEDAFTLQVKEVDLVRAGDLVEKSMGLPEG